MKEDWIRTISQRYIELYEKVIGKPFKPETLSEAETYEKVADALKKLPAE